MFLNANTSEDLLRGIGIIFGFYNLLGLLGLLSIQWLFLSQLTGKYQYNEAATWAMVVSGAALG